MHLKKHIPNAITCGNLVCGCLGIIESFHQRLDAAFYLIILAAVLDFFDGFAARMLRVISPIGKDLDSLADMVTFGVLPGFILYRMISNTLILTETTGAELIYTPLIAFSIPVFSALRLAKFNNDSRQTENFIGLATPANTLFFGSLGYISMQSFSQAGNNFFMNNNGLIQLLQNPYALSGLSLIMSFLLIAEIPMFGLKFKHFNWNGNQVRYLFLIISIILLIVFKLFAIPFIILLYLFLSVVQIIFKKKNSSY